MMQALGVPRSQPRVEARDFAVRIGTRTVLDGCDLRVAPGEIAVVRGPSGGGKSTLLRALARLQPLARGTLLLDGEVASFLAPSTYRSRVAYVPQLAVMLGGTVADNLQAGPRLRGDAIADLRIAELLGGVGLDTAMATRPARSLSGGEKQRVALARALALAPVALLLDEPTSALDPASTRVIGDLIRHLAAAGTSVVVVSHDDDESLPLGGARYVCIGGRLTREGGS